MDDRRRVMERSGRSDRPARSGRAAGPGRSDLAARLARLAAGRTCFVGLGNPEQGDDGFGVRLARRLAARCGGGDRGWAVIVAGTEPERHLGALAAGGYDHVVFLDAAAFGAAPGSVTLLGAAEIVARFPQVSTHRLGVGLLARLLEGGRGGPPRAWLLAVQPESLRAGPEL